ncbi:MAG TPA: NADH-quinone oxidoreductase subunit A [Gammaproteobacteria bacterium]
MLEESLWPLAVYVTAALVLVGGVLAASYWLGERHAERATGDPFESGVVPVHRARFRFHARFYLVAVLFVIFDIEAVFIITWAVIARDAGWAAFIEIAIFIAVLLAALAYLWRIGALDWSPSARRAAARRRTSVRTAPSTPPRAAPAAAPSLAEVGDEA